MTRKKRRNDAYDDGRTIANMNVEGMPGYRRAHDTENGDAARADGQPEQLLSPRETRMVLLAGMKWAFLLSAGLALILILFILFCVKVWLA